VKNQLIRVSLYSIFILILLFLNKLNFLLLASLYFIFMSLEFIFSLKDYKIDNKYIVLGYRTLFILITIIVIFNRENIIR